MVFKPSQRNLRRTSLFNRKSTGFPKKRRNPTNLKSFFDAIKGEPHGFPLLKGGFLRKSHISRISYVKKTMKKTCICPIRKDGRSTWIITETHMETADAVAERIVCFTNQSSPAQSVPGSSPEKKSPTFMTVESGYD